MDRATRDKFAKRTDQTDLNTGNALWETPPAIFEKLNEEHGGFDLDICANGSNHLCKRWLGPGSLYATDALSTGWMINGISPPSLLGFCNPPYGAFVQKILKKAQEEREKGFTSVFLLPLRVTRAFRSYILRVPCDLKFCDSRITFWENGAPRRNPKTGKPDCAMFDSIIVTYSKWQTKLTVGEWKVPKHV